MGQGRHKAENITRRQAEVMQEISRFFSIYGKMPTMQQLANTFGIAAPSIYDILQELVSKGYLKRIEKGSTALKKAQQNRMSSIKLLNRKLLSPFRSHSLEKFPEEFR